MEKKTEGNNRTLTIASETINIDRKSNGASAGIATIVVGTGWSTTSQAVTGAGVSRDGTLISI